MKFGKHRNTFTEDEVLGLLRSGASHELDSRLAHQPKGSVETAPMLLPFVARAAMLLFVLGFAVFGGSLITQNIMVQKQVREEMANFVSTQLLPGKPQVDLAFTGDGIDEFQREMSLFSEELFDDSMSTN